jgi:hypothetical protein
MLNAYFGEQEKSKNIQNTVLRPVSAKAIAAKVIN